MDPVTDARLTSLYSYRVLDTRPEQEFDDIVAVACRIAAVPYGFLGFAGAEQIQIKAAAGVSTASIPLNGSYCAEVVATGEPLVIPDTAVGATPRTILIDDTPTEIRFYAGVPVFGDENLAIGTLCVMDTIPREDIPADVVGFLQRLARQVRMQLELRRSNAALFEERDTFSVLFEAAPAPMLLVERGVIVRANYAFSALVTDQPPGALEGQRISSFIESIPLTTDAPTETVVRNELGDTIPTLVYTTRLKSGEKTLNLLAVADITDRKAREKVVEEQRINAENANRIKDMFLSLVSHDLRSPISGIHSLLDVLNRDLASFSQDELVEAIGELRTASALLVEMVNQLLNIHRLQSGSIEVYREEVPFRELIVGVRQYLTRQIQEKGLIVEPVVEAETAISIDIGLAREALFNLVANAVKFSPDGGRIRIVAGSDWIAVEDQGPGVDPEIIDDLFRAEIKTSRPGLRGEAGTGLGLPLVADIMAAHNGRVYLDPDYRNGSRFVLQFGSET